MQSSVVIAGDAHFLKFLPERLMDWKTGNQHEIVSVRGSDMMLDVDLLLAGSERQPSDRVNGKISEIWVCNS